MILITKAEYEILRKRFPELAVSRTIRKIYVPEKPAVLLFLRKLRNHPEKYEIR